MQTMTYTIYRWLMVPPSFPSPSAAESSLSLLLIFFTVIFVSFFSSSRFVLCAWWHACYEDSGQTCFVVLCFFFYFWSHTTFCLNQLGEKPFIRYVFIQSNDSFPEPICTFILHHRNRNILIKNNYIVW